MLPPSHKHSIWHCMAYAKTTPGQVFAQLAAGATVAGICYHSLFKDPPAETQAVLQPNPAAAASIAATHHVQQQAGSSSSSAAAAVAVQQHQ